MIKKVVTVYGMLFLFAFTFAFAFAMEVRAEDPGDICCDRFECPDFPGYRSEVGHMVKGVCMYDGNSKCDTAFVCAEH